MSDLSETIRARGHEHVSAQHTSTLELTSDDWLTPAGDCILAIEADRTPAEFADEFKQACAHANATIRIELEADDHTETIVGRGDPGLTFAGDRSAVARTSDYVDDRTIAVSADKAAGDLDRDLVAALSNGAPLTATLTVER